MKNRKEKSSIWNLQWFSLLFLKLFNFWGCNYRKFKFDLSHLKKNPPPKDHTFTICIAINRLLITHKIYIWIRVNFLFKINSSNAVDRKNSKESRFCYLKTNKKTSYLRTSKIYIWIKAYLLFLTAALLILKDIQKNHTFAVWKHQKSLWLKEKENLC